MIGYASCQAYRELAVNGNRNQWNMEEADWNTITLVFCAIIPVGFIWLQYSQGHIKIVLLHKLILICGVYYFFRTTCTEYWVCHKISLDFSERIPQSKHLNTNWILLAIWLVSCPFLCVADEVWNQPIRAVCLCGNPLSLYGGATRLYRKAAWNLPCFTGVNATQSCVVSAFKSNFVIWEWMLLDSGNNFWSHFLFTESNYGKKIPEFSAESLCLLQGMPSSGRWCHMTLLDPVIPVEMTAGMSRSVSLFSPVRSDCTCG